MLEDTYNKESKLVSGYNYFLSVLENVLGDPKVGIYAVRSRSMHQADEPVVILLQISFKVRWILQNLDIFTGTGKERWRMGYRLDTKG